jgi:hypothetical protein
MVARVPRIGQGRRGMPGPTPRGVAAGPQISRLAGTGALAKAWGAHSGGPLVVQRRDALRSPCPTKKQSPFDQEGIASSPNDRGSQ